MSLPSTVYHPSPNSQGAIPCLSVRAPIVAAVFLRSWVLRNFARFTRSFFLDFVLCSWGVTGYRITLKLVRDVKGKKSLITWYSAA